MIGKKAGAAYDDAPWLIISTTRISIAEACPTMLILPAEHELEGGGGLTDIIMSLFWQQCRPYLGTSAMSHAKAILQHRRPLASGHRIQSSCSMAAGL